MKIAIAAVAIFLASLVTGNVEEDSNMEGKNRRLRGLSSTEDSSVEEDFIEDESIKEENLRDLLFVKTKKRIRTTRTKLTIYGSPVHPVSLGLAPSPTGETPAATVSLLLADGSQAFGATPGDLGEQLLLSGMEVGLDYNSDTGLPERVIGTASGICTLIDAAGNYFCNLQIVIIDNESGKKSTLFLVGYIDCNCESLPQQAITITGTCVSRDS